MKSVQLEIDREISVAYLRRSFEPVAKTVELSEAVNLDLDVDGELVGVEVVGMGSPLPLELLEKSYGLDQVELGILASLKA